MMTTRAATIPKPSGSPELIFSWRKVEPPVIPRLLALGIGAALVGFLIGAVRIQVLAPEKISMRQASLIYLRDDAEGRAWTLLAQEGGPFPARFEPHQWQGLAELENTALDAVRFKPRPYLPAMQDLPRPNQLDSLNLAAKGEVMLPQRRAAPLPIPDLIELKLAPVIGALSGISPAETPRDLPAFEPTVTAEMAAVSWRFILELDPSGTVIECIPLAKANAADVTVLENWLSRISFPPHKGPSSRWIAVQIAFTNQPLDGTEAR
jgi:hypothetical protein